MTSRAARWVLAAVIGLQLALSVQGGVQAYDITQAALSAAANDALRLSRYEFPRDLRVNTVVRAVPDGTVAQWDGCTQCGPRMYYVPEPPQPNVQYFFVELGVQFLPDADGHGLMVHEVVHFLQYHAGAEWNTCAAEVEATEVQNLYLAEQGLPPVPVWHPGCGPAVIEAKQQ